MKNLLITLLSLSSTFNLFAQTAEEETDKITHRFFMPSIQMGYINHQSGELSGGLFIQTSLEYQTRSGIFFRLNYDDFDADYELNTIIGSNSFGFRKGQVSFAEFVGGIGYRQTFGKHNFLGAVQPGYRFYGFPTATVEDGNILLGTDSRNVLVNRYTFGYEFEIDTRAFLTLELFGSHSLEEKDFWEEDKWAAGFTIGITTTIF